MIKVTEKLPREGQVVVAYFGDSMFIIAIYRKVLTWRGRKIRFVNGRGQYFNTEEIVGWNRIPQDYDTVGGTGHRNPYEKHMVCDVKTIDGPDSLKYKEISFKGDGHSRSISLMINEFDGLVDVIRNGV